MAAYTTIDDPSAFFKCHLYSGNGSTNAQTFADTDTDMQPDMVWIKSRSDGFNHMLYDAARGVQKHIKPDTTAAEATDANSLTAFGSDGFTVGTNSDLNNSGDTYVAWCWKAGGSASSQTDGDIDTSRSVSTTAGFSIATYTGNGTNGATRGHGLGVVPHLIVVKNRTDAVKWYVYHHKNTAAPETDYLTLNSNAVTTDQGGWNDTAPTSTLVTTADGSEVNQSGKSYVMYSWVGIQGFSKFGTFVGNGDNDGPFLFCGFKPSFFMSKRTDSAASWNIWNNKSNPFNPADALQYADGTDAEASAATYSIDFLSNGIKMRGYRADTNTNGAAHIWMAFAEQPFVNSNGVPNNAR